MDVTLNLMAGINGITRVKLITQWPAGTHRESYINVSSLPPNPMWPCGCHTIVSTLVFGDTLPYYYILLCTQSLWTSVVTSWQGPDQPPILREALQRRDRSLGDGVWSTVLSEFPHSPARAPGLTRWLMELSFPEAQGNFVSLAHLEYWAKATHSLLREP